MKTVLNTNFRSKKRSRFRPKVCCLRTVLVIVLTFSNIALAQDGNEKPRDLYGFLKKYIDFSDKEFSRMKSGAVVVKLIDTRVEREVAAFGIMRVNITMDKFVNNLTNHDLLIESSTVLESGEFSNPPVVSDIQNLTLDPGDLKAIKTCKIGDCDFKLSAKAIEQLHTEIDRSAPENKGHILMLLRKMMVGYVQSYLTAGNAAMAVYHDKKYPLPLVKEFHDLLRESPYLYVYQPKFHDYLENYPQIKLPGTDGFIYWAKEDFGAKRQVISLSHIVIYHPPERKIADVLIASKQLFASHYFEASFGITALANDPDDGEPGFYLIHLNRSRLDVLRHPKFGFIKNRIKNGIRELLQKKMVAVKKKAEALP